VAEAGKRPEANAKAASSVRILKERAMAFSRKAAGVVNRAGELNQVQMLDGCAGFGEVWFEGAPGPVI
jgi:hypothetical protein